MTPQSRQTDLQQFLQAAGRELIEDRWSHAGMRRRVKGRTNEHRANGGHQDVRIEHQIRQAERKLPWSEQVTRAIARWREGQ